MDHYYTYNKQAGIAMFRNPETGFISATEGSQPETFVPSHWTDHGPKTLRELQEKSKKDFPFPKKARPSVDKKKVYDAYLKAGHSVETARQISGYTE